MSMRESSYGSSYTEGTDTASICSDNTMPTQYGDPNDGLYNPYPAPDPRAMGLPCEFVGFGCNQTFNFNEVDAWIEHIIADHLLHKLPSKAICWFCDTWRFDSKAPEVGYDRRQNFENRMWHIREHFIEGKTVHDIRPDFHMLEHLHRHKIIAEDTYIECKRWNDLSCRREEMKHVRSRNFVSPEMEARNRRSQQVPVDIVKDERQRKKAQGQKGKEPRDKPTHRSKR
ncbi:hypothetical protein F5Y00DRAFT_206687 [Daldinia vernicosa]|uniref:uncharacterized protein n=1 Tax=Daldinia vernicosa TaxID=114800 RepID=UPI002007D8D2|nr:uncharacterized protein F5Y00DRAFT_206687 [Daldinia vernicosa]KAI0852091.1 hypothetical protein F5Y00DRAFT_206687 [Daldinia vernicosa]